MRVHAHAIATVIVAAALAAGCASTAPSSATVAAIDAAVADPARPDADRARDADRKPAGYYTRILSAVVGPTGHVHAMALARPPGSADGPEPGAAVRQFASDPHYANVGVETFSLSGPALPQRADVIWTSQNYHDLHGIAGADLVAFDKAVFAALKPGGTFLVLDHAAEAGSGARDVKTRHRIDPALVRTEALAAGFVLDAQSNILANPADTHLAGSADPAIRSHTDQFVFRFRKPL
jgi:predicted methyltransferase